MTTITAKIQITDRKVVKWRVVDTNNGIKKHLPFYLSYLDNKVFYYVLDDDEFFNKYLLFI